MGVAMLIGRRSRCSRAQIGAVIVSLNGRIASTGYNGPAASWPESTDCIDWCKRARGETPLDKSYDGCPAIHAEMNALMYVDRSRVEGGTLYVNSSMCMNCAKAVSNSGLNKVVLLKTKNDAHRDPEDVIEYLRKCSVEVVQTV
jgi:dCMP deaminase